MDTGDYAAIFQAVASVILLIVTGWYAWLTKSLAESAQRSATSAAEAAAASSKSVSAQLALVPITFRFEPVPQGDSRDARLPIHAIRLSPTGANVWLHSMKILDVGERYGNDCRWIGVSADCTSPLDPLSHEPRYLQNGETWQCAILPLGGGGPAMTTPRSKLVALRIGIGYSLESDGPQLSKIFEWRDGIRAVPPAAEAT